MKRKQLERVSKSGHKTKYSRPDGDNQVGHKSHPVPDWFTISAMCPRTESPPAGLNFAREECLKNQHEKHYANDQKQ